MNNKKTDNVPVIYCHVTNHPKTQRLKATIVILLRKLQFADLGKGSSSMLMWYLSAGVVCLGTVDLLPKGGSLTQHGLILVPGASPWAACDWKGF